MIGKNNYTVIQKAHIPPEIIDQIPEFDSLRQDHYIERKKMDELNRKCENYSLKIERCIKLKEILEYDVERLIFTYGRNIDISWYSYDPQCYYHLLTSTTANDSNTGKVFYSYRDHRTVVDINRRRDLVLQNDKKVLKPIRKIARNLPFPCEKINPFDEKWLIWSKRDQIDNLIIEIEKTISLFNRTQKHIETLTFGIDLFLEEGINTNQKFYESRQKERQLWKEFSQTRREKFDSFFERMYSWYVPPTTGGTYSKTDGSYSQSQQSSNLGTPREILSGYKIHNKKEWKEWLRNNHTDKGGNVEDCQKVITLGRELGY
uniref:Uncharacterized protein n=1 Tax=Marseillevirus LCMAC101 TaxID=2506602 RepID=A0A481YRL0_9VIRU|nr:MAG: hypothetical protein LCMAC101_04230 [Marseillevirus LCMAC101]